MVTSSSTPAQPPPAVNQLSMEGSEVTYRTVGSEDALKATAAVALSSAKTTLAVLQTYEKVSNATLKAAQATIDSIQAHLRYG
jgi:hypothetical protein